MTESINTEELSALIRGLSSLHEWETQNLDIMKTATGRHMYFSIAKRSVAEGLQPNESLKQAFGSANLSDRALRMRIREMIEEELIVSIDGRNDARCKNLIPTEKFNGYVYEHAMVARRILGNEFFIIPR